MIGARKVGSCLVDILRGCGGEGFSKLLQQLKGSHPNGGYLSMRLDGISGGVP
jgi:hypothetical protein